MNIVIQDYTDSHDLVIVTTRKGYSYACIWAKSPESPTVQEVKDAWRENRKNFDPWFGSLT